MSAFVIINEWTTTSGATSSEVVDSKYFESESDAWDALKLIADSYLEELPQDERSFVIEYPEARIESEEYYIQELTKG